MMLHNGTPCTSETISIHDPIVTRGDGCFEAMRGYEGFIMGLHEHLVRLENSADRMAIRLPSLSTIRDWVVEVAAHQCDGVVRVFVSADESKTNVYVYSTPLPIIAPSVRLLPIAAPWHPGGEPWDLAGVKTLSYAPNVAATRLARREGFDDALLLSREGMILEAPTAGVLWVVDGVVETSELSLGILASVTTAIALDAARDEGMEVRRGRFTLDRLDGADELALMSTIREILPVTATGERHFDPGPVTAVLAEAYKTQVEDLR